MFKTKLIFEWDENKRLANFFDVKPVFLDPFAITLIDNRKDYGEIRSVTIGRVKADILASVCHTDRFGVTRIISFRKASKKERKFYDIQKKV